MNSKPPKISSKLLHKFTVFTKILHKFKYFYCINIDNNRYQVARKKERGRKGNGEKKG